MKPYEYQEPHDFPDEAIAFIYWRIQLGNGMYAKLTKGYLESALQGIKLPYPWPDEFWHETKEGNMVMIFRKSIKDSTGRNYSYFALQPFDNELIAEILRANQPKAAPKPKSDILSHKLFEDMDDDCFSF